MANDWPGPFDPSDYKDYVADWSATLVEDTITDAIVELTPEASTAGLKIDTDIRPPAITHEGQAVTVWFEIDEANRNDPIFDGAGTRLGVIFTVETLGGRRLQQTWTLGVMQR